MSRRHRASRGTALGIAQEQALAQRGEVEQPKPSIPKPTIPKPSPPRSAMEPGRKIFVDQLVIWLDQRRGSAVAIDQMERAFPAYGRNSIQARMGELTTLLGLQVVAAGRAWVVPVKFEVSASREPEKKVPVVAPGRQVGELFEQIGNLADSSPLLRHSDGSIWSATKLGG